MIDDTWIIPERPANTAPTQRLDAPAANATPSWFELIVLGFGLALPWAFLGAMVVLVVIWMLEVIGGYAVSGVLS